MLIHTSFLKKQLITVCDWTENKAMLYAYYVIIIYYIMLYAYIENFKFYII